MNQATISAILMRLSFSFADMEGITGSMLLCLLCLVSLTNGEYSVYLLYCDFEIMFLHHFLTFYLYCVFLQQIPVLQSPNMFIPCVKTPL